MTRPARETATGDLFAPPGQAWPEPDVPPVPSPDRRIWIGTSGWSFADWVGPFYPPGTPSGRFLEHYARHFDCVEVNATYYGVPRPQVFEGMVRRTPPHFRFVVKLHRQHTHERVRDDAFDHGFREAIEPLRAAGRYDGALAQFPWAFRDEPANREWLVRLRERFPDDPLFVEFRHRSWATAEAGPFLRAHGLGWCAVDEPAIDGLMPPLALRTAEDAYVRFHGRNAAQWWGNGPLRYDWNYTRDELGEWLQKIAELAQQARRTYLFFNNCHAGHAATNAKLMREILRQQKLPA